MLRTESETECETWKKQLAAATKKLSIEGLQLQNNNNGMYTYWYMIMEYKDYQ